MQATVQQEEDGETWVEFNFEDLYDVLPGHEVIFTDGVTTKSHIVTHLGVTDVDLENDLVIGVAEPEGNVELDYFPWNGPLTASIRPNVDANGDWIADFREIDVDINKGDWFLIHEYDEDNDQTIYIHDIPTLIDEINVLPDLAQVNTPIDVSATFSYPSEYPFIALWDWGDGTVYQGTITGNAEDGYIVTGDYSYPLRGVYTLRLTVDNDHGVKSSAEYQYVVVYDPNGGFVSGAGFIDSEAGWCHVCANASGKARFGFVSKYQKGATVPLGKTIFNFNVGGLRFHSESYDWLVVNQGGTNAQFKGTGTINGEGAYKFMLWAGDGETDTFRIKIWIEYGDGYEWILYDNETDQEIGRGNIVVHTKK
jgi:hypothetical protein